MTDKEFINTIIVIVNSTNDTYTEDRAEGFDFIQSLVRRYLKEKEVIVR